MHVVILGPGALGSLLGAALADAGHEVVLLGRQSPHLSALRQDGLRLTTRSGEIRRLRIEATADPASAARADTIVVLVKTPHTAEAASAIAPYVRPEQAVLTLQNGLGNAERLREALGPGPRILAGTTSQAAMRTAPGVVVHTGQGPTLIGYSNQEDAGIAKNLAKHFTDAGWPSAATCDIQRWLWRKAAINAAINGLTALGGFPNGVIADDPDLIDSAELIAEEAAEVARAQGIELGPMRRHVLETAAATADNRSSMLQDMEAGRRTEVASIHGAILAAGAAHGIETPAIRVMAALIQARERAREDDDP
jgi:2-dehydropantoate 2-reductase